MITRIEYLLKEQNITQNELARRIKVSSGYMSQLLSGAREINDRIIALICATFHVNEQWLRTGEGSMRAPNVELDERAVKIRFIVDLYSQLNDDNRRIVLDAINQIERGKKQR